ncbi:unnamed protein product [Lepidochelys kempii]
MKPRSYKGPYTSSTLAVEGPSTGNILRILFQPLEPPFPGQSNLPPLRDVTFKCQTETQQVKEQLKMCKDVFQQGITSEFCSFMNSTLVNLETMCAEGRAASLEEVARPFGSFLNSSILSASGNESKREVASAVTFLLQSVELAALMAALWSPEKKTQNMTTEFMAIETLLVRAAGRCDEVFRLRGQEETMDIYCNAVTRADTKGRAKKEEEETRCVHWKFIAGKGTWAEGGCKSLQMNHLQL